MWRTHQLLQFVSFFSLNRHQSAGDNQLWCFFSLNRHQSAGDNQLWFSATQSCNLPTLLKMSSKSIIMYHHQYSKEGSLQKIFNWTFSVWFQSSSQTCQKKHLPKFDAVVLFGEPIRWETSLQLILDVLMTDGHLDRKPDRIPYPHIPVFGCNMDLLWMAEAHLPR